MASPRELRVVAAPPRLKEPGHENCRGSPRLEYLLSPLPPADGQKEDGKISRRLTDTEVFLSRAVSVANLKLMRSV